MATNSEANDRSQLALKLKDQVSIITRYNTEVQTQLRLERSYSEMEDTEVLSSTVMGKIAAIAAAVSSGSKTLPPRAAQAATTTPPTGEELPLPAYASPAAMIATIEGDTGPYSPATRLRAILTSTRAQPDADSAITDALEEIIEIMAYVSIGNTKLAVDDVEQRAASAMAEKVNHLVVKTNEIAKATQTLQTLIEEGEIQDPQPTQADSPMAALREQRKDLMRKEAAKKMQKYATAYDAKKAAEMRNAQIDMIMTQGHQMNTPEVMLTTHERSDLLTEQDRKSVV